MEKSSSESGLVTGTYRCDNCGESFLLMLPYLYEQAIGGLNTPVFATHGPGCNFQVFHLVDE